jgi:Xaa-Pro aminopeptidase
VGRTTGPSSALAARGTNAVITVEPGLYVQSGNYGIRVEDLYLVTPTGSEHLSKAVPRTVAEVEAAMASGR